MAVTKGSTLSAWAAIFTLGNCAIGAGILSFPYAFKCSGLVGGILLTLGVALVVIITASTVVYLAHQFKAPTYQVLVLHVLGPAASNSLAVITTLYLFGACVAYLIVIGETFQPLVERMLGLNNHSWLADRRTLTTLAGFLVVLPLSLNRTLGALAGVSSFAIAVMTYTAGTVALRSVQMHGEHGGPWVTDEVQLFGGWSMLQAIPIMSFAFQCHVQSVLIYAELTPQPSLLPAMFHGKAADSVAEQLPRTKLLSGPFQGSQKLLGMFRIISTGVAMVGSLYMLVGIYGYLAFPVSVGSNILTSFSSNDVLIQISRAFVGCAVVCHYPATHHAARAAFDDLLRSILGLAATPAIPWSRLIPETVVFFLTSYLIAISVDDLGVVFRLLGGTGATLLIFVMPGAMLMVLAMSGPQRHSRPLVGAVDADEISDLLQLDGAEGGDVTVEEDAAEGRGGAVDNPTRGRVVVVAEEVGVEAGSSTAGSRRSSPERPLLRRPAARMTWRQWGTAAYGLVLLLLGVGLFGNTLTNIVLGVKLH